MSKPQLAKPDTDLWGRSQLSDPPYKSSCHTFRWRLERKCRRSFEKIISFKPRKTKKRGGKKQRKMSQKKAELKCRKERKMLHKKCAKISPCCSLYESCHHKTRSIIAKIIEIKTNLKQNREICKSQ
ncbi:hypothetical protein FO519_008744 [Halicephalobus sp. NKZ332]|nr:hypothetical protein FO519_008744 [Halicephalobus sp. NKZ332]